MYKVINYFIDLQDDFHPYEVGDEYPRPGIEVTEMRVEELAGSRNKQGKPLIEKVEESKAEEPKVEEPKAEKPKKKAEKTEEE